MKRIALLMLCMLAALGFCALCVWQLERRAWKLELIARVEERIHAAPVALPPAAQWGAVTARGDEYRRVRVTGRFLHDRSTLVDALTEEGSGYWVLTPLVTTDGVILINRGFVPSERKHDYARPQGEVALTGLLRMTEPGGRFLRPNRPEADLWYSRDVAAIAISRHLGAAAPFFIDAEGDGGYPQGGLTVVRFRNMHLVYALTWLALAIMSIWAAWILYRDR